MMSHQTTIDGSTQLSSSLKERLKRCGRYHSSPKLTPTRDCFNSASALSSHENNTPVRKRALSSPLLCGKQKRRQIINSLEYEKENTEKTASSLSSTSTSNVDCAEFNSNIDSCNDVRTECDQSKDIEVKATDLKKKHIDTCSITENDPTLLDISSPSNETHNAENDSDLLCKELKGKEEILRQLKLVQMYRSKNDLDQLQTLIDKWRGVVQQVLPDLHAEMTGDPKPSLTQLIDHLGIDHGFIEYDPEEETFG